jgi:hypothetical protein
MKSTYIMGISSTKYIFILQTISFIIDIHVHFYFSARIFMPVA